MHCPQNASNSHLPYIRVAHDRANLVIQSAAFQSLLITSYDVWPRDMVIKYIPAALLIFQGDSQIPNTMWVYFIFLKCTVYPLGILYYRYFVCKHFISVFNAENLPKLLIILTSNATFVQIEPFLNIFQKSLFLTAQPLPALADTFQRII